MDRTVALLLLASFGTLAGCGGGSDLKLLTVSGTLKYESGDPVPGAQIYFMPVDGGIASQGITDDGGSFSLRTSTGAVGAVVGMHKVTVAKQADKNKVNWNDPQSMNEMAARRGGGGGGRQKNSAGGSDSYTSDGTVPVKYEKVDTTPLSYDVTADGSHSAIELTISKQ